MKVIKIDDCLSCPFRQGGLCEKFWFVLITIKYGHIDPRCGLEDADEKSE